MISDNLTDVDKEKISKSIKNIQYETIVNEYNKLKQIFKMDNGENLSPRSRIGNNIVDFFTFTERLNTKGKYDINFYEFIINIELFKEKKFIQNMLEYYKNVKNKNNTKNNYVVLKEVYNICISSINIFRPIVAINLYKQYKPTCVLDFTCGWGGRLVGACILDIPKYIGIDINMNLEKPYNEMCIFLNKMNTKTQIDLHFKDALNIDYSKMNYDMVFTSPPYFFIEKYSHNNVYETKNNMKDNFYIPLFTTTFKFLKKGGYYCLNVNQEMYKDICVKLFGNANNVIELSKSKKQNNYVEYIYIWHKTY